MFGTLTAICIFLSACPPLIDKYFQQRQVERLTLEKIAIHEWNEVLPTIVTKAIAISPSGKLCAVGHLNTKMEFEKRKVFSSYVIMYDAVSGKELYRHDPEKGAIESLTFSPDSKYLAIILNTTLLIWDVENRKVLGNFESLRKSDSAFSPDGTLLAAGWESLEIWDWQKKSKVATIDIPYMLKQVQFSEGKKLIALSTYHGIGLNPKEGSIEVYDSDNFKPYFTLPPEKGGTFALSKDGRFLAHREHTGTTGRKVFVRFRGQVDENTFCVTLIDLETKKVIRQMDTGTACAECFVFSPDGKYLFAGLDNGEIAVWNTKTGEQVSREKQHDWMIEQLAIDNSGTILVSRKHYAEIGIWRIKVKEK